MDPITIVALISSAAIGLIGGGGIVSIIQARRQGRREDTQDIWDSFEKQIALAEDSGDTEDANRVRGEYAEQLKAWRAQQDLEEVAPREISVVKDAPSLPTGEIEQLKRLLHQSQALSPALLSAQEHFHRGNAYYAAGEYENALPSYSRALELRPDDAGTLTSRGATFWRLGRYDDTLADYNRSLELRPDHADTLMNRGVSLDDLERYDEALADYNRALELRPEDATTLMNRGVTLDKLERYVEALADYNRSLELRADNATTLNATTLNNAAISLDHIRRTGESLEMFARAIDVEPQHVVWRLNRASLQAKVDDLPAAQADLDWALEHGDLETFRRDFAGDARKHPYFDPLRANPSLLDTFSRILGSD